MVGGSRMSTDGSQQTPRRAVVEVFADIGCPYAHVGLRRFVHQRCTAGRPDLRLHVRAWPLELVNGEPLDAAHVTEVVEDLRRQVAPALFAGFDPQHFPTTTLPALDLVSDAYALDLATGERASLTIRTMLFEHGQDIGDPAVLDTMRSDLGLWPARVDARTGVLDDWVEGQRRGVVGSPHFFVGDDGFFCPTLEIRLEDGRRRVRIDTRRFEDFFSRCTAA